MSRIPLAMCLSDGVRPRVPGIGLLGCGTVGGGVARALARTGIGAELRRIGVRDPDKARPGIAWERYDRDLFAIVDDPDVQVVIECIGGTGLARELVTRTIARGKHVITANKELIATEGPWLTAFAARTGGSLRFEAAVGGAIPIVRALTESLAGEDVLEVAGVLNGTTNFVLDAMAGGASYAGALAEAQRLGFAEADPSADVDGHDAAHKLAILAQLAFRLPLASGRLARRGIRDIDAADVAFAAERGTVVKLVAAARVAGDGAVEAAVTPALVPRGHAFAAPLGPSNCVRVVGRRSGALTFGGAGAGGDATASAIVGDLLAALRDARSPRRVAAVLPSGGDVQRALRFDHIVRLHDLHYRHDARAIAVARGLAVADDGGALLLSALDHDAAREYAAALDAHGIGAGVLPMWGDAA